MKYCLIALSGLLLFTACDHAAGLDAVDGGDAQPDSGPGDTDTGIPFTGWDACVYVFTGWYTKYDECTGSVHSTAGLIALAEQFCSDNWAEMCDLAAPSTSDLAYHCRFAIKVATCEELDSGVWFEDEACVELTEGIDCDFPEG